MLQSIDTFLAFAVTMLGISLVITCLTQIVSSLLAARGANLRDGVATLLETLDPKLAGEARNIAQSVLTHPLISDSSFAYLHRVPVPGWFVERWKVASAIGVDEFRRIIAVCYPVTALPAGTGASVGAAAGAGAAGTVMTVGAPAAPRAGASAVSVSAAVNAVVTHPEFKEWFDSTMTRLSSRFALNMRLWTVFFAALIAFGGHVDSARLFDTFQNDAQTRARLLAAADGMLATAERVQSGGQAWEQLSNEVRQVRQTLDFQIVPRPWPGLDYSRDNLLGIALSAVFLSLGAPFWYNVLKSLTNLRPVLAGKVESK